MKQIIMLLLCCLLFVGCAHQQPHTPPQETEEKPVPTESTQPSKTLPEPTESQTEAAASFTVYTLCPALRRDFQVPSTDKA